MLRMLRQQWGLSGKDFGDHFMMSVTGMRGKGWQILYNHCLWHQVLGSPLRPVRLLLGHPELRQQAPWTDFSAVWVPKPCSWEHSREESRVSPWGSLPGWHHQELSAGLMAIWEFISILTHTLCGARAKWTLLSSPGLKS